MSDPRRPILALAAAAVALPIVVVLSALGLWWLGLIFAVAATAGVVLWLLKRAGAHVDRTLDFDDQVDLSSLANVVDGICLANGIEEPALAAVDSDAHNAALLWRGGDDYVLVSTRGLLDSADLMGLEAVAGHLLAQPFGEVEARTFLASLPGIFPPALLERFAPDDGSRIEADLRGLEVTRYPPGLAATLESMLDGSTTIAGVGRYDDALWLAPAANNTGGTAQQERIEDRIEVLREL